MYPQCADCDGPLYSGRDVVVAGGGDSALQEALTLAQLCAQVHIVNKAGAFTGRSDLAARVASQSNIAVLHDTELECISGTDGVESVIVRKLNDSSRAELACAAVFVYVGLVPNSDYLPTEVQRDEAGRVVTDTSLETTLRGAFAAGAVRRGYAGTLGDAMREGRAAGERAIRGSK